VFRTGLTPQMRSFNPPLTGGTKLTTPYNPLKAGNQAEKAT